MRPVTSARAPTDYRRALLAVAVWAGFSLVVTLVLVGPPPSVAAAARAIGSMAAAVLVAALLVWPVTRHVRSFRALLLLALPAFLALRLVLAVAIG